MTTYDVFLSHASDDKPAVEALARRLREDGIEPFLDRWHLVPGQFWQEGVEKALESSRTCAVFVGEKDGPWQNLEMRAALNERAGNDDFRVIPVLLPGASRSGRKDLPLFLRGLTWVDFSAGLDDEDAYHRLRCGIRGEAPGAGSGTATPVAPRHYRSMAPAPDQSVHRREIETAREALVDGAVGTLPAQGRRIDVDAMQSNEAVSLLTSGKRTRSKVGVIIAATAVTLTLAIAGLRTLIGTSNDIPHSVRIHPTALLADLAYRDFQKGQPLRMEIAINGKLIGQVDPYLGQITILSDHALSEERSNSWDISYREFFEDPKTKTIIVGNIYDYEYFDPPGGIHHRDELHIGLLHGDDLEPFLRKITTLSFLGQTECQEVELDVSM